MCSDGESISPSLVDGDTDKDDERVAHHIDSHRDAKRRKVG